MTDRILQGVGYSLERDNYFAQWSDDTVTFHECTKELSDATIAFGRCALAKDGSRESGSGWRDAALAALGNSREVKRQGAPEYWRPQGSGS